MLLLKRFAISVVVLCAGTQAPAAISVPSKQAPAKAASKKAPVPKAAARKSPAPKKILAKAVPYRRRVPVLQPSPKVRAASQESVFRNVTTGADIPVEHAAALIPFFEQLYRHQKGESQGPLRILQYGDSHTAADEWTGDIRAHFQEKFGDGGAGYSYAGRPWNGYRRLDVKTRSRRRRHLWLGRRQHVHTVRS
jgi:hypothetical protein